VKILYDSSIYRLQRTGGINRYFEEIISRLPPEARPVFYGAPRGAAVLRKHPRSRSVFLPPFGVALKPLFRRWTSAFGLAHPTYYHLQRPFDWDSLKCPVVVTVHDFTFERFGHLYAKSGRHVAAQAAAIRRADRIICVSEATRRDLFEFFPGCRVPVDVIPHGPSLSLRGDNAPPPRARPYFLYVGSRVFYKNFPLALEALSELRRRGGDADLVVAGEPLSAIEIELTVSLGLTGCIEQAVFPGDEELAFLYRGACALIYPSCNEGFGLPALEAMAAGTPVVGLRASSMPEVVGEGGVLLPPEDANASSLADALADLLEHPGKRKRLATSALAQANCFDWTRSADATWNVYQAVAV